jgi:hypothetical protein
MDVDGDGAEEIVLGGHGELSILSSDGSTLTRVRLAGLDRAQVWDFELVRERGEIRWFAAAMSWETPERDSHVGLFASDGRELWSFEPPEATGSPGQDGKITAGATLAAGDLDGDGTTEYLAGVTYVQWNQAEGDDLRSFGSHMSGHLFVLDGKGAILSQTRLGDSINLIEVVPAAHAGAPATILCGTEKGLERFAFKPQP